MPAYRTCSAYHCKSIPILFSTFSMHGFVSSNKRRSDANLNYIFFIFTRSLAIRHHVNAKFTYFIMPFMIHNLVESRSIYMYIYIYMRVFDSDENHVSGFVVIAVFIWFHLHVNICGPSVIFTYLLQWFYSVHVIVPIIILTNGNSLCACLQLAARFSYVQYFGRNLQKHASNGDHWC